MSIDMRPVAQTGEAAPPLRSRAETLLQKAAQPMRSAAVSMQEHEALHLLHELQVHVELQLQNDELEQARAEALSARDRYARLFELAPVAVLDVTRDGRIVQANRAAAALLRRSHQNFTGAR